MNQRTQTALAWDVVRIVFSLWIREALQASAPAALRVRSPLNYAEEAGILVGKAIKRRGIRRKEALGVIKLLVKFSCEASGLKGTELRDLKRQITAMVEEKVAAVVKNKRRAA